MVRQGSWKVRVSCAGVEINSFPERPNPREHILPEAGERIYWRKASRYFCAGRSGRKARRLVMARGVSGVQDQIPVGLRSSQGDRRKGLKLDRAGLYLRLCQ
jgi:hypothetical protein